MKWADGATVQLGNYMWVLEQRCEREPSSHRVKFLLSTLDFRIIGYLLIVRSLPRGDRRSGRQDSSFARIVVSLLDAAHGGKWHSGKALQSLAKDEYLRVI